MVLRQEDHSDHKSVYRVNSLAFEQEVEAKLVELLRSGTAFVPELSLVAQEGEEVIGHILFSKVKIRNEHEEFESLALAPVAVLPAWQRKGVGKSLIRKGLDIASELGFKSVIVLGHTNYYPKFGFEPAIKWHIKAPFEVPSDVFMALELVAGSLMNVSGTVIYPPEFESV